MYRDVRYFPESEQSSGGGGAAAAAERGEPASGIAVVIPYAQAESKQDTSYRRVLFVVLTIALLAVLGWIGWSWWTARGTPITVEFTRPQNVVKGTPVILNGVRIGRVEELSLLEDQRVNAHIQLTADDHVIESVTREGTAFWIPRFTADLTRGVRNVEAMFSTKIVVQPGPGPAQYHFVGRASEPPNVWVREGELPVVVRASRNRGATEGAPVRYRGVEIGRIVRAQLSSDSNHFEAWLRIYAEYRVLVRTNSRFVNASGLDLEVGLSGMSMQADSLQSVVAGEIVLFTPDEPGPPAEPGRAFALEAEITDEYRGWAPSIAFPAYESMYEAVDASDLPKLTQAVLQWSFERGYGWLPTGTADARGLVLETDRGVFGLRTLLRPPEGAEGEASMAVGGERYEYEKLEFAWEGEALALITLAGRPTAGWNLAESRAPTEVRSCVVIGPGQSVYEVAAESLEVEDGVWVVQERGVFDRTWNGAVVLSEDERDLIGVLAVDAAEARIHVIPGDAPFAAGPATKAGS